MRQKNYDLRQKLKNVAASEPRKLCRAGVVACNGNEIWYEEAQRGCCGHQGSKVQKWLQMTGKNMGQWWKKAVP